MFRVSLIRGVFAAFALWISLGCFLGCSPQKSTVGGPVDAEPAREAEESPAAPSLPEKVPPAPAVGATTDDVTEAAPEPAPAEDSGGGPDGTTLEPLASPAPALLDETGAPLPQTDEKPTTESDWFKQQGALLFDAIVKDDASLAEAFFFPVVAYQQVKDIKNPEADWNWRLMGAFKRDVHKYHRALGLARKQARFVEIRVTESAVKWMKPGAEGNRIGYHRVLRSVLVCEDANQKKRELSVVSMISWRGNWYVVHLAGFE